MEYVFKESDFEMIREPHMIPIQRNAADRANQILAQWIEKNGTPIKGVATSDGEIVWGFDRDHYNDQLTHQAIIINIKAIEQKKDTAEDLLRELLDCFSKQRPPFTPDWIDRVQKVLEEK